MRILLFGKDGQVGRALRSLLMNETNVIFLGREDCNLVDPVVLEKILDQYQAQVIINASAFTAVDKAQTEIDLANAINTVAPEIMAKWIADQPHGLFIHYSTDYVFGDTKTVPYDESDETGPLERLGVYAQSKLAAENVILQTFSQAQITSTYYILRTSWVYGDGSNFIKTMLRLAEQRESLSVIADQVGAPTSADLLARIAKILVSAHSESDVKTQSGIYAVVPHGYTSWHGLASFVTAIAKELVVDMNISGKNILPITALDYPLPSPRPYNSRLSNAKLVTYLSNIQSGKVAPLELQNWKIEVEQYVRRLFKEQ